MESERRVFGRGRGSVGVFGGFLSEVVFEERGSAVVFRCLCLIRRFLS